MKEKTTGPATTTGRRRRATAVARIRRPGAQEQATAQHNSAGFRAAPSYPLQLADGRYRRPEAAGCPGIERVLLPPEGTACCTHAVVRGVGEGHALRDDVRGTCRGHGRHQ